MIAITDIAPRLRRTACLLGCSVAALLALVPGAPAAPAASDSVGFGVAPLRYDVAATPGKATTHPITISNTDTVATTFTFSKRDFQGDKEEPAATPQLLDGKFASAISGHDWIGLPEAITVPPGQERTVNVRIAAPSGSKGGHYAAVVVHGARRAAGEITAGSGLAVLFLMNAGGVPPPDINITEVKEEGRTTTRIEYINKGQTHVTPPARVVRRDPITRRITEESTGTCTTALPGGSGVCTVERQPGDLVGNSPSGLEDGYVELGEAGGDDALGDRARAELPTEWAGTWTSLILPLVGMALFLLYFLFLRRRRKDEEGEDLDGGFAIEGAGGSSIR